MKDFIKWLGVNEKVGKAAVWLLIIMIFLIVTNTMLESIGFPNYQITYDNLKQINSNKILEYIMSWIIALLNFYSITLLVFRISNCKKLFKYSIIYLIANIIVTAILNPGIAQIFIILFFTIFSYFYSNKNKKYIFYSLMSVIINIMIQGITYTYRMKFIEFSSVSEATRIILSIDYFIIMGIIILVKEIYLKKRGERDGN